MNDDKHREAFIATIRTNPINAELLDRLPDLDLPDCWLVAGCLFQTAWNASAGRPPTENIRDYDVFYFDPDLTYGAEDAAIRRASAMFADLDAKVEVRNQARVHLWYEQHFGRPSPKLTQSTDGIDRFLIRGTCIGLKPSASDAADVYATHGLQDLEAGLLRPNPLNDFPAAFAAKAQSYQSRWPWLRVEA